MVCQPAVQLGEELILSGEKLQLLGYLFQHLLCHAQFFVQTSSIEVLLLVIFFVCELLILLHSLHVMLEAVTEESACKTLVQCLGCASLLPISNRFSCNKNRRVCENVIAFLKGFDSFQVEIFRLLQLLLERGDSLLPFFIQRTDVLRRFLQCSCRFNYVNIFAFMDLSCVNLLRQ